MEHNDQKTNRSDSGLRQRSRKSGASVLLSQSGEDDELASELEEERDNQAFIKLKNSIAQPPPLDLTPLTPSSNLNERLNLVIGSPDQQPLLTDKLHSPSHQILPAEEEVLLRPKKLSLMEFVWIELTRGYSLQQDQDRYTEKRRKVYAFIRIPFELEKFFFYGFLQCLDSFCHTFTFLPIRIIMNFFGCIARIKDWTAANTCDILKVVIIFAASWFMQFIDTSVMYHQVRGQSVIKLYIFYNMLEVADKLFSSFGQDILDALLWTASERRGKRKFLSTLLHLAFAIIYALCHSVLVLLQATTLNVAFNSHNQSLLTIMMSNNFVELKGSVFKKFAKPNLFQMSCSDVRERFHTVILLVVVVLRNMTAVNWKIDHFNEMIPDLIMVILAELLVDWLKHAFITKFNEISAEVYQDFTITLAFDVVRSHEKNAFTDFSDQVSRRMGFIPIPISIMLIRVISQSIDFGSNFCVFVFVMVWLALLITKIVTGVFLHDQAVEQVIHYRNLQEQAKNEIYRRRILAQKSKSAPGSPRLSLIDFTDVLTQATAAPKTLTASDMLAHWDELVGLRRREPSESKSGSGETPADPPRRCQSMVDFCDSRQRRDKSLPPVIPEEERNTIEEPADKDINAARSQASPKRRIPTMECESLSSVQAYTILNESEPAQDIQP